MFDLNDLRKSIDLIDSAIINLLAERMRVVKKVGERKRESKIPPLDEKRWKDVLNSKKSMAKEVGLEESLVEEIWNSIHRHALKIENEEDNS